MRYTIILLLSVSTLIGCGKYEVDAPNALLPVTEAVKKGDWMVSYFENTVQGDMGLTFLKFNSDGTLVATKDGTNYNGTWSETNASGNNTLTLAVTTTDAKLQKANRAWKVTSISEYFIDLKDANVASKATVQLMKH